MSCIVCIVKGVWNSVKKVWIFFFHKAICWKARLPIIWLWTQCTQCLTSINLKIIDYGEQVDYVFMKEKYGKNKNKKIIKRNSASQPGVKRLQIYFSIFLLFLGLAYFCLLTVSAKVQISFGSLAGLLTLLPQKMELLHLREVRELETLFFFILPGSMTLKHE